MAYAKCTTAAPLKLLLGKLFSVKKRCFKDIQDRHLQLKDFFSEISSPERSVTGKLLSALQKFGSNLSDYMHLFLPPIVRLFDSPEVPMQVHFRVVDLLIGCGRC